MIEERLQGGRGPLHGLDPRARLVGAAAWSVAAAVIQARPAAWAALATSALLLAAARPPLGEVARRLGAVNAFIALLWLLMPFSTPGQPVLTVAGLAATRQGLELAALITLKSNAIVLAFMALVATIPVQDLGHALRKVGVPLKLALLLVFTHRAVQAMSGEYRRMRQAMTVRGFVPRTGLHTWRAYACLAGMLLVRGMDRAERVREAMLCRGFTGELRSINPLAARPADHLFLAAMLCASALLAWAGLWGTAP